VQNLTFGEAIEQTARHRSIIAEDLERRSIG
jgi:hypothetical protein